MEKIKKKWGIQLVDRPLDNGMLIQVEISKDKAHTHRIQVSFNATPKALCLSDANLWAESLKTMIEAAKKEAEKF
jgi:hypothetical protein